MNAVHCVPNRDDREHELTRHCWCDPMVEWTDPDTGMPWAGGGCQVIHQASDCRELVEQLTDDSIEPGKDWAVVEV